MITHPLFPLDGSESPELTNMEIQNIHVRRMEAGKWAYATTCYAPEALETIAQLHQIYGGGDYMLEARDNENRFCRTRRLTLPGAAKSLTGETAPAAAAVQAGGVAPATPDATTMMLSMMQLMMQQQQAQTQQTTQVLIAAMGRGDAGNSELNARRAELERQARQEYNQFITLMMERVNNAAPNAAGGQEGFMSGVEFAQGLFAELAEKAGGGADNPADMLSTLKNLIDGLGAIGKTPNGSPPPPGAS